MQFIDSRRLTGPNLLWDRSSVILDVACTPEEGDALQPLWETAVRWMCAQLGWAKPTFCSRRMEGGLSLAFEAPIDALYAGIAVAEWAWEECGNQDPDFNESASLILARTADDANPAMVAMQAAAAHYGVPFLWDDDAVSVGYGPTAVTWLSREVPESTSIAWHKHSTIPIALVTGTNGKTTTSRMAANILRIAGKTVGLSSTEGVMVNDAWIERGDYSGPGGARMVLRHPRVDAAVLETARGGLLRRGLGVEKADVAVITNIAADHLGDFGSRTMQELLDIKWIVSRAVRENGTLVLNADDPLLVEQAKDYDGQVTWFSMNAKHPSAEFVFRDGVLTMRGDALCRADEIPLTLGGIAKHNIANALAAAALCDTLGANMSEIREGLVTMDSSANPGRGNLYRVGEVDVLVDFAHNPHAMEAIASVAREWPATRRILAFAQAGDRTDELVREFTRQAWSMAPDVVFYSELTEYARGRSEGELFGIVKNELLQLGADESCIVHVDKETQAVVAALSMAEPGDLLVLLVLAEGEAVRDRLTGAAQ